MGVLYTTGSGFSIGRHRSHARLDGPFYSTNRRTYGSVIRRNGRDIEMAGKEARDVIRKGADAWNQWRRRAPEVRPDLANINLAYANLAGADLSDTNLWEAVLKNAVLKGANLSGAELCFADLSGANLTGADLRGANLTEADLTGATLVRAKMVRANCWGAKMAGADLSRASLVEAELSDVVLRDARLLSANLNGTDLGNADLTGAILAGTVIEAVDLRKVLGLDAIRGDPPPVIGLRTLCRSAGRIPLSLLDRLSVPSGLGDAVAPLFAEGPAGGDRLPRNGGSSPPRTSARHLFLDDDGKSRFPDTGLTVITADRCPVYTTADRLLLSGPSLTPPPDKAACAILMEDVLTALRKRPAGDFQRQTISCSGCTGRIRLVWQASEELTSPRPMPQRELDELVRRLSSFPIFESLQESELSHVVALLGVQRLTAEDVIIQKGEPGKNLYIIVSGQVEVVGEGGFRIALMGKGDVFGEMSLLLGKPAGATIKAIKTANLLFLRGNDFRRLLNRFPPLQMFFTRLMAQRLNEVHDMRSEELASGMVGKISEMPPAELMQTLNINQKTGELNLLLSRGTASVYFRDGALVGAIYDELTGKPAFYEILKATEGRFKFVPVLDAAYESAESLGDFMWLLMEGLKQIDESNAN